MAGECYVDYFFVGGSLITQNNISKIISLIKKSSDIPVVIFPGNNMQICTQADAILFLSLISGRNPDLLIGQHVNVAPLLKRTSLEVIPTGYLIINDSHTSSVSYMSNTLPIPSDKHGIASATAVAGEMLGLRVTYLDAGSGARQAVTGRMIRKVKDNITGPLVVGGGINTMDKAVEALGAGADVIVIGNAIEKNPDLMIEVSEKIYDMNKKKGLNIH